LQHKEYNSFNCIEKVPERPKLPDEGKVMRKAKGFPVIFSECGVQGETPTPPSAFLPSFLEFKSFPSAFSYVFSNERCIYKFIFLMLKIKKSLKSICFPSD